MKQLGITILALVLSFAVKAQLNNSDYQYIANAEDSLVRIAADFNNDTLAVLDRHATIGKFVPLFIDALKRNNSFAYSWDSLQKYVSILEAPDSTFKLYTWQLYLGAGVYRYYGAIQMNEANLKLFPLFDTSDTLTFHTQETLDPNNWYGAMYYNMVMTKAGKKKYYTVFGIDKNDYFSDRKVADVLHFENDKPVFGAQIFSKTDSLGIEHLKQRWFLNYKYDARVSLNYSDEYEMIIFDHIQPTGKKFKGVFMNYIPDGTYEGFRWQGNKWVWVEKVFHFSIGELDNPPMPAPVIDKRKE